MGSTVWIQPIKSNRLGLSEGRPSLSGYVGYSQDSDRQLRSRQAPRCRGMEPTAACGTDEDAAVLGFGVRVLDGIVPLSDIVPPLPPEITPLS